MSFLPSDIEEEKNMWYNKSNGLRGDKTVTFNKKALKITAIVLAAAIFITASVFAFMGIARAVKIGNIPDVVYEGEKLNVILMIGDGMGPNHVKAAEARYGELFMTSADVQGELTTYSRYIFGATDSAAAATALATGYKTDNGNVGQYLGKAKQSTTELAISLGMSTAILATEGVDGATPAGFSAHTSSRNDLDGILEDQLASGVDVFFGSNIERYEPLKEKIQKAGYSFADGISSLDMTNDKVFASFEEIPLDDGGNTKPTLASLALLALDKISANDNGFFMMIEESHIDKCSHDNDLDGALSHVKAYDNTVKAVVEYAMQLGNTIVIVTADHETGGLKYNGESDAELSDGMYTLSHHSTANVPYFVFGNIDYEFAKIMDNSQIAKLCQAVINGRG